MSKHVRKQLPKEPGEELSVTLDFSNEEKRGRLHAQPAGLMKEIWELAREGVEGRLYAGIPGKPLHDAGSNLAYLVLVELSSEAGGMNQIDQLVLGGQGPAGVRAVSAIQRAYNDNFGVGQGRDAEFYLSTEDGVAVGGANSVVNGLVTGPKKVKEARGEFEGKSREILFSRFPGTRTGIKCVGIAQNLSSFRECGSGRLLDTGESADSELDRLHVVARRLTREYDTNALLLSLNAFTKDTLHHSFDEFRRRIGIVLPHLYGTNRDSRRSLSRLKTGLSSETQEPSDIERCMDSVIQDVVLGTIQSSSQSEGVGLQQNITNSLEAMPSQMEALLDLRTDRDAILGLLGDSLEEIQIGDVGIPNAELAVDIAARRKRTVANANIVESAKDKLLRELTEDEGTHVLNLAEGDLLLCSRLPSNAELIRLKNSGVRACLADEEVSRLSHEKIVAAAIGLPVAGGFGDLSQKVSPGQLVLIDDDQEYTHMVVLVQPKDETLREYGISQKKPIVHTGFGRRKGTIELADGDQMYLSGTLQFLNPDSVNIAKLAHAHGIGLVRLEIDMQDVREDDWFRFGDDISRRRLEARYYQRTRDTLRLWEKGVGSKLGSVTLRLPDLSTDKMSPLMLKGIMRQAKELGVKISDDLSELVLGTDFLVKNKDDLMLPIIRGACRGILNAYSGGFRDDSKPRNEKFKAYIELPAVETPEQLDAYYRCCEQAEKEVGVAGIFGRKVMIESKIGLDRIDEVTRGVDDIGIGSSDVTKDALDIQSRLDPNLNPLDPNALMLLNDVVGACRERGHSPEVCGPMTEDIYSLAMLVGMGVRRVSVNPFRISHLAMHLKNIDPMECERLLRGATRTGRGAGFVYENGDDVRNFIASNMRLG